MALKTYGDKPISFQVEENGEYYCVGSEVSGVARDGSTNRQQLTRDAFCRLETTCASLGAACTKSIRECPGAY